MSVLNMHEVKKSYGINTVLDGFSMDVSQGEKVALIGANGSGKTTLFRIITGKETMDQGSLSIRNDIQTGYLTQIPDLDPEKTLREELCQVFSEVIALGERISDLEEQISRLDSQQEGKQLDSLMAEYSELQEEFENKGGYYYESKIERVAVGLGFSHQELDKKVKIFSGGEKTRLGLVKLLLEEPDLLLLDEPTNHLDISSTHWLEKYLNDYEGSVIIISHDRYFLDQVVERIIELKQGQSEVYHGNYSYYLEEREKRFEQRMRAYENQQKKIAQLKEAIDRLHRWGQQSDSGKLHNRAQSMEKRLEKMEKLEKPVLVNDKMNLELEIESRSGDEVLIVEGVDKSFGQNKVLDGLDLQLFWSEKSSIIGDNGTGKTTLLKIITGELARDSGKIKLGAGVKMGYYSQEFNDFYPEDDVLTAYRREVPVGKTEARNTLASFLFTGRDVFENVSNLSGGEKSRLRLLQLMKGNYNFLLLDEPTNHLDLPSREVLEEALKNYPGTLLIVSHDRYFLNKVVDYTYELSEGSLLKFYGNYDYYRDKKKKRRDAALKNELHNDKESSNQKENDYVKKKKQRNRRQKIERKIEETEENIILIEEEMEELEKKMADPENLDDHELLIKMKKEYHSREEELSKLYKQWEELTEKKEG
ncbi:MAG: ribosomal protection-like ABC-F family protein [Bacillota bacterium]